MQKRRMLALVTAASISMSAFSVQAWTAGRADASGDLPVLLRNGSIYMNREIVSTLHAGAPDAAGRNLYVVQFSGPVNEAYKAALTRMGAELGDYLPENAFLVRMDAPVRAKVQEQGYVKGVATYSPAYKVDQSLTRLGDQEQATVRIATFGTGTKGPVGSLSALGVKPEGIGNGVITATLNGKGVRQMAQSADVVYVEPVMESEVLNDKAAGVMGVTEAWKTGLDGKGQVVAVTDTGLDTGKNDASMHPDFQGQVKQIFALGKPGDASDTLAHGTHVAGSVLGTGKASGGLHKGMAPGAQLVMQSVEDANGGLGGIPEDLGVIFKQAYEAGARIHTNSWGVPAASGGTVYNAQSQAVDRFIWEHPDYTILFAAGNDGDHDQDGKTNYNTVSTPGTSKNAITVGASQNNRPDKKQGTNTAGMASFSSRGPTADGRVKPDVVAPGTWIASARSSKADESHFWAPHESNSQYGYMGGTSMATPLTAGATALVRQHYMEKLGVTPRAALLKATLINGAVAMDADLTWKDNGWGRVDIDNSLNGRPFQFVNEETALKTGEVQSYSYTVKAGEPLKVTLAWSDYPANPSAQKTLVNDLDLVVKGPDGKEILGNAMLGATADRFNNVENVVIAAPAAGTYTVTVKGYNVPQGPQRFALVTSGQVDEGAGQPTPPPQNPGPTPPAAGETTLQDLQFTGKANRYGTVGRHYIDVTAGATVVAYLGAANGEADLTVTAYDGSGRQVATGSARKGLRFTAGSAGTYSLAVSNSSGYADYSLWVTYSPMDGTTVVRKVGLLSADGAQYQTHSITVGKAGSLNAMLSSGDRRADLDLYLVDGRGRIVAQSTSPNLNPETLSAEVAAGTYTIYVLADSGKAGYQLTIVHPK